MTRSKHDEVARRMRALERREALAATAGCAAAVLGAVALAALAHGCVLADPRPDPGIGGGANRDYTFGAVPSGIDAEDFNGAGVAGTAAAAVSGAHADTTPVAVVGFAVPDGQPGFEPGGVVVENVSAGGGRALGFVPSGGSYAVAVDARPGDMLIVTRLVVDGATITELDGGTVYIVSNADAAPVNALTSASVALTAPSDSGLVTVSGAAGSATPGSLVAGGNLSNAGTAETLAALDGSFSLTLLGQPGDRVTIFTRSNLDPTSATAAVTRSIPAP
jgi:hypothetical protein